MRFCETRTGARLPILGQGTWKMGERAGERSREVGALQLGFDLGLTLVDTAEMYADGGAEEVVAEAVRGRRDDVFIVSKVLPANASRQGTMRAAERSLQRMGIDCVDLYLLHWISGAHPLEETLQAFEVLREQGKIRHYGVSNFDVDDMEEAERIEHGERICANQVYYTLDKRGIERKLIPWCQQRAVTVMAYSPLDMGRVVETETLEAIAARHEASVHQVVLAWTLRHTGMVTVVKSSDPHHVRSNARALDLHLDEDDLAAIDAEFPCPSRDVPLATA